MIPIIQMKSTGTWKNKSVKLYETLKPNKNRKDAVRLSQISSHHCSSFTGYQHFIGRLHGPLQSKVQSSSTYYGTPAPRMLCTSGMSSGCIWLPRSIPERPLFSLTEGHHSGRAYSLLTIALACVPLPTTTTTTIAAAANVKWQSDRQTSSRTTPRWCLPPLFTMFHLHHFSFISVRVLLLAFSTHKPTRNQSVISSSFGQQFALSLQSPFSALLVHWVAVGLCNCRRRLAPDVTVPCRLLATWLLSMILGHHLVGVGRWLALSWLGRTDDSDFLRWRIVWGRWMVLNLSRTVSADKVAELHFCKIGIYMGCQFKLYHLCQVVNVNIIIIIVVVNIVAII